MNQQLSWMCRTQQKKCHGSLVFCRSGPLSVVVGQEGAGDNAVVVRQVSDGGCAKLINGITSQFLVGKGAIKPLILPSMLCFGWEGEENFVVVRKIGKGGCVKLVEGVTTPFLASKGAIIPLISPPTLQCGQEGEAAPLR
jgi:hypothetical protein